MKVRAYNKQTKQNIYYENVKRVYYGFTNESNGKHYRAYFIYDTDKMINPIAVLRSFYYDVCEITE